MSGHHPYDELRAKMSLESQERAKEKTREMLADPYPCSTCPLKQRAGDVEGVAKLLYGLHNPPWHWHSSLSVTRESFEDAARAVCAYLGEGG